MIMKRIKGFLFSQELYFLRGYRNVRLYFDEFDCFDWSYPTLDLLKNSQVQSIYATTTPDYIRTRTINSDKDPIFSFIKMSRGYSHYYNKNLKLPSRFNKRKDKYGLFLTKGLIKSRQ